MYKMLSETLRKPKLQQDKILKKIVILNPLQMPEYVRCLEPKAREFCMAISVEISTDYYYNRLI